MSFRVLEGRGPGHPSARVLRDRGPTITIEGDPRGAPARPSRGRGAVALRAGGPRPAMFKFLHCADIHLDSPLRGLDRYEGAPVAEIRRSAREAMANLTELAARERVAFVAIAGDLYD